LHESKHNHAIRKLKGPGKRFLLINEMKEIKKTREGNIKGNKLQETLIGTLSDKGLSKKRKCNINDSRFNKRARQNTFKAAS
jgi:hypothetical protein